MTSRSRSKRTAIDVFSGCGGMTYGLRRARFRVIGALERDAVAADAYRLNHPTVFLKEADIRDVDGTAWMAELGLKGGELDLLAGCPPCQGFSRLRRRNGSCSDTDELNRLVLEMARMIRSFLPKAVMMENVPGLAHHAVFEEFLEAIRGEGYVPTSEVLDVRWFGVPQRRKRLVLLAGRGFTIQPGPEVAEEKTVRMAIGGLKPAGRSGDSLHDMPERRSPEMKRWIALVPKDGGSRLDLPEELQRPCHRRSDGYKDVYGRMAWDKVAPTITGGCFNPSKGRFLHPEQDRNVTMREAALLQGLPKSFRLPSATTKSDAAQMIGNALPPEFVRRQAVSIRRTLIRVEVGGPGLRG
jgi:DNA (cytosine-5)-methyltransferase 1